MSRFELDVLIQALPSEIRVMDAAGDRDRRSTHPYVRSHRQRVAEHVPPARIDEREALENVDGCKAQHRPADRPVIPAPGGAPNRILAWSEDVREHLPGTKL